MKNKIYVGNALHILKKFKSNSIDCVVTSPPYWGLRDYKTKHQIYGGDPNHKHEWIPYKQYGKHGGKKSKKVQIKGAENFQDMKEVVNNYCECGAWKGELGREPRFEMFISDLCDIFDEVKRVLKDEGSCWVNLGDTYWGGGNAQSHTAETTNFGRKTLDRGYVTNPIARGKDYEDKCLVMIPERFAIEMIQRGWILRQKPIWEKPNCMPHPVKDRSTINYENFYHFVKQQKYYYKQQFEPLKYPDAKGMKFGGNKAEGYDNPTYSANIYDASALMLGKNQRAVWHLSEPEEVFLVESIKEIVLNKRDPSESILGMNKTDVWEIITSNSTDSHFAVYPRELIQIPIDATCPKEICNKCGKAREMQIAKIEEGTSEYKGKTVKYDDKMLLKEYIKYVVVKGMPVETLESFTDEELLEEAKDCLKITNHGFVSHLEKLTGAQDPSNLKRRIQESLTATFKVEWTDCGCEAGFHSGTVLDPFFGSGTTGIEALAQGKNFIGIEVSEKFARIALKNIKAFKKQRRLSM